MRKKIWRCVVVGVGIWGISAVVLAQELSWEDAGRGNLEVSAVLVCADAPGLIYIGAKGGVFRSTDAASSWRNVLSLRGDKGRVNFLLSDPDDKNSLYAATAGGLFYSANRGANWRRIFKGRNYLQSDCRTMAVLSGVIYLGTGQGLFISRDKGHSWHKESGKIGDSRILALVSTDQGCLYAASTQGVFRKDGKDNDWEKTFLPHLTQDLPGVCDDEDRQQDTSARGSDIRYLAAGRGQDPCLYLATSRGIYVSTDKGKNWEAFCDYGLLDRDVTFLLATDRGELYAAASSGIFKYTGQRWQELSFALSCGKPAALSIDKEGNLYAACDKGLFRALRRDFAASGPQEAAFPLSEQEPGVEEVQKAAIKYAEVCPEKIKLWRRQAMASALLPTLSATVNRDAGDLWHWESGSSTKSGDDVLIKGRDSLGWDVRLSWDLSRIIWNPDQTSIDVRSKLMVELRNDILDEVNKTYFERQRLKLELDELRIEDRKKRIDKQLRIRELTASLDALTGGYFSRKTRKS